MRTVPLVLITAATLALSNVVSADTGSWSRVPSILASATSWHEGEAIPSELSHYRESPSDLGDPTDSASLIGRVTNLALLSALATDLDADSRCRDDAFVQGTYAGGPTKFFAIVSRDLLSKKGTNSPWLAELRQRIEMRYVVVNALFIEDVDMPRQSALQVLDRIEHELRAGAKWETVYRKYADEFGYRTGNSTTIGLLGDLVVYADPALGRGHFVKIGSTGITWQGDPLPPRLNRLAYFDPAHLPLLMSSAPGDVIRAHSSLYSEFVLYQVEEVYPGLGHGANVRNH